MGDEDKQFEASPQKLKKAKEEGQVIKSKDVSSALFLMIMFMMVYFLAPLIWGKMAELFILVFEQIPNISYEKVGEMYLATLVVLTLVITIGPFLIIAMLVAAAGDFFQVGPLVAIKAIEPKFDKLNPVKGIKNLITMRSLFELVKNLVKIGILGYIGYLVIKEHLGEIIHSGDSENLMAMMSILGKIVFEFMIKTAIVFFIIAMGDYLFQRWKFMADQKMSMKELKDEFKNSEGDPHVKAALRQRRMQMAMRAQLEAVPDADVIITNPIHYAVALRYQIEMMEAPKLIAKGTELFADKIKSIAQDHGIPVVENEAVARALYRSVEVDQIIPPEMYQAVAEILMFAWRITGKPMPQMTLDSTETPP